MRAVAHKSEKIEMKEFGAHVEWNISAITKWIVSAIAPLSRPQNGESCMFRMFEKKNFKNVSAMIQKSLLISNKTTN